MKKKQENTNTSMNLKKPQNSFCKQCKSETKPYLIPAILDLEARWIAAPDLCVECFERKEHEAKIRKEQQAIEAVFRASRLSPRFRDRTFKNFQVHGLNKLAYQTALNFDPIKKEGLMLYGSYGIGKTHLAAAIANKYLGKLRVLYISCPDLLLEIRDSMNGRGKPESFSIARNVPLLVLDDIGAEKPSDWVRETLFVLINHRYEYKLPTVFTTNCSLEELEQRLGGRIVSRLAEMCRFIKFSGRDFRITDKNSKVA